MGQKYSSNSTSGYNATPPADDGTVSEANKGKWSTIKEKLADPVKTLADAINTDLVEHFDNGPVAYTSNQTIGASHYGKVIQVSGAANTQTLSDAATLGAGWNCEFVSTDTTNTVTIGRATASDMVNETTANISLLPLQSIKAVVNAAANGFLVDFRIRKDKASSISENITLSSVSSITLASGVTGNVWTTGDVKLTIKTSADSGWVIMDDGTIGNASSNATTRANADTESLFSLIWGNISNIYCPIYTSAGAVSSRGADAATDYAANKRLRIPRTVGRALAGAGSAGAYSSTFTADAGTDVCTVDSNLSLYTGAVVQVASTTTLPAGLSSSTDYYAIRTAATTLKLATSLANAHAGTAIDITDAGTGTHTMTMSLSVRTLGQNVGEESHSITSGENGPHIHTGTYYTAGGGAGTGAQAAVGTGGASGTAYVPSDGNGTAANNMQPSTFMNVMIKL